MTNTTTIKRMPLVLRQNLTDWRIFSLDWLTVNVITDSVGEFLDWFSDFLPNETDRFLPVGSKFVHDNALALNGQYKVFFEWNYKMHEVDGKLEPVDYDTVEDNIDPKGKSRGITLCISGDGLRYLNQKKTPNGNVSDLLYGLTRYTCHFTRLDVALDFFDADNDVIPLLLESCWNTFENVIGYNVIGGFKKIKPVLDRNPRTNKGSTSFYIGARGSGKHVRIYDKACEQLCRSYNYDKNKNLLVEIPDYWYRIELMIQPSRWYEYPDTYMGRFYDGATLQDIFVAHLQECFRVDYVDAFYNHSRRVHGSRHTTGCDKWEKIFDSFKQNSYSVQFTYLPYVKKSLGSESVLRSYGPAVFTAMLASPKEFAEPFLVDLLSRLQAGDPKLQKHLNTLHDAGIDESKQKLELPFIDRRTFYDPYSLKFEDFPDLDFFFPEVQ